MPWLRLHHVFALAVWDGRVYWSDWETRAVESCRRRPLDVQHAQLAQHAQHNGSAGGAYDCRTLLHTVHKPMDLRVYHPARQPPQPGQYCTLSQERDRHGHYMLSQTLWIHCSEIKILCTTWYTLSR